MRALAAAARWQETAKLPDAVRIARVPDKPAVRRTSRCSTGNASALATQSFSATYTRPYLSHGSIGPSCAVAQFDDDALTVWTHTQGVFPDRDAIAEMLHMPKEKVRCIHSEGAGCYGHNGADDVAADAALLARALPGRPVRVQWTREQEHAWEPYGPAMVVKFNAALDAAGKSRLGLRRLEQYPLDAARIGRLAARRALPRRAVSRTGAQADPDAGGRRRSQFHSALQISPHPGDLSLPARHAGARFRFTLARRPYERLRHRKFHGRTGGVRRRRPRGVSPETSR